MIFSTFCYIQYFGDLACETYDLACKRYDIVQTFIKETIRQIENLINNLNKIKTRKHTPFRIVNRSSSLSEKIFNQLVEKALCKVEEMMLKKIINFMLNIIIKGLNILLKSLYYISRTLDLIRKINMCALLVIGLNPYIKYNFQTLYFKLWIYCIKILCIFCIKSLYNVCIFCIEILFNLCRNIYLRILFLSKQKIITHLRYFYKQKIKNFNKKERYVISSFLENNTVYHLIIYKKFLNKLFSIEKEKKTFYLINDIAFNRAIFMKILAQKLVSKSKAKVITNIKIIKLNFIKIFKYNLKEYRSLYHLSIKITAFFFKSNSIFFINGGIQKKVMNKNDYLNYILKRFLNNFYNKNNFCKLVIGTTKNNFQKRNKFYRNQNFTTFFIIQNISISNNLKLLKIKAKSFNQYYYNIKIKTAALNCALFLSLKCFRYRFTLANAFNLLTYAYKKYMLIFFRKVTINVLIFFLNTLKILITIYLELIKKYALIGILIFNILKKTIKTIFYFFQKFSLTNILTYCLIKNVEKILYYILMKFLFKKFSQNFNIFCVLHFYLNKNEKMLSYGEKRLYLEGAFQKFGLKKEFSYLFDFYQVCLYVYKIWLSSEQKYFRTIFKKINKFLANIRLYNKIYKIKNAHKLYAFSRFYCYRNIFNFRFKNKVISKLRLIEIFICCLKLNLFQNYIIKNKILAIKKFIRHHFKFFKKNSLKFANNQTFIEKTIFITPKNIFNLVLNFKQTSKVLINLKNIYFNFSLQLNICPNKSYNLFFIKKILQKYVLGQDHIIVFLLNLLNFSKKENCGHFANKSIFLFYGLKNVGKTQTVKALAIGLFNSTKYLAIYNMFYYTSKLSIKFLIHEYYNVPKFLSTKNKNNLILVLKNLCSSIIYLKNIEKAHPYLLNIFINILKTGFFKDINNCKIYLKINFLVFSFKYNYLHVFKHKIKTQELKIKKYHKRLVFHLQRKLYRKKFLRNILVKFIAKMHKICKIAIFKILVKFIVIKIFNLFLLHFAKYLIVKNIKLNVENNVKMKIISYNKHKTISLKFLIIILIIKPILKTIFKYSVLINITVLLTKKIKIIYNV